MGLTIKGYKPSTIAVAAMLFFASLVPVLGRESVSAAQITDRSIQLSSSAIGTTTDGQDVIYQVSFDVATTSNIGGVVIDFCDESPIIGATCTAPTGFNSNFASLGIANQSAALGANTLSVDATNSTAKTVILTRTVDSIASSATIGFDLGTGSSDGFTNPSATNSTFYARILTYATAAAAQSYASTSVGTPVDEGGVAISTAEQLTITAKVPERLVFCVFVDDQPGGASPPSANDCSGSGSAVSLGDDNGALHPEGEFINKEAYYAVSTNAGGGTIINVKGSTLTSSAETIDPTIDLPNDGVASSPGSEQFGLCTYQFLGSGLTPHDDYDGATGAPGTECTNVAHNSGTATTGNATPDGTRFQFNTANTESTYGDTIASKTAGDFSTGNIAFVGNISPATAAGIYEAILTFIATGTY